MSYVKIIWRYIKGVIFDMSNLSLSRKVIFSACVAVVIICGVFTIDRLSFSDGTSTVPEDTVYSRVRWHSNSHVMIYESGSWRLSVPNIPHNSVPSATAAARVVRYYDSTEMTFFNRRGNVIETRMLDVPNPGIHAPGSTIMINTFENGSAVQNEGVIERIVDREGNDMCSSHTEWYGDKNVIRRINETYVLSIPLRQ